MAKRKAKTVSKTKKAAAPRQKKSRVKKSATKPRATKKAPARVAAPRTAKRAPSPRPRKSLVRRAADAVLRAVPRLIPRLGGRPYETDLDKNAANYQSLTPMTFLERAA